MKEEQSMPVHQTPKDPSVPSDELREIAYGFQKSRVLLTAFELGIFSALGNRRRTSHEVATSIATDPRATDRLMNALCALGVLRKQKNKFSNTPLTAKFLVMGKPTYLAGTMHTVHLWNTWSTLTEAVKKGRSVLQRAQVNDRGDRWLSAFIAAMHDRARKSAKIIAGRMNLSGVRRLLDIGGGSGAYAIAFAQTKKDITATVFDLPKVIPLTKKYVRAAGLSRRINFIAGDYVTSDLGKDFDLVFLSAIVHSNSMHDNQKLIKKCANALRPGGRVVVQDFIMDENRVQPPHGAMFALNMLVGTDAGDTFTEHEVSTWMKNAGLVKIERNDTPFGTVQIIGWKK